MIVKILILIILAVIAAPLAVWFRHFYQYNEKLMLKKIFDTEKKDCIIFFSFFILSAILMGLFYSKHGYSFSTALKYLIFIYSLFLTASIDLKQKKIPNIMVLFILAERIVFFIPEFILYREAFSTVLLSSLVGLVTAGFIMIVCRFISRGGMGAGDVKLFSAIGFMVGLSGVVSILFYSLFLASAVSIFLLVSRKAKFRETIPMAPFIFAGSLLYVVLN